MLARATAAGDPIWIVRLRVEPGGGGRSPAGEHELRRLDELVRRTGGVCSSALVPTPAALGVTHCLAAPDAIAAVARARALTTSCARRAGLAEVRIDGVEVT